jgi:glycosyltransferase involved in cell wall biosynthesis
MTFSRPVLEKGNGICCAPLRIALVTVEFEGPTRNGGIGTACRELASALREVGHEVSVFFAGPFHHDNEEFWKYALALEGIEFTALQPHGIEDYNGQRHVISAEACRWLKSRDFDVVHFHDWLGFGLDAVQMKRAGTAFADTLLCTTLHGPTHWVDLGNEVSAPSPQRQEVGFAERRAVEGSDVVFSPSRFLLDEVIGRGWKVPRTRFVRQNILGQSSPSLSVGVRTRPVTELVFFGRLEKLKGLDIFCDTIDLLRAEAGDIRLTFLGRQNTIDGEGAASYIERRARSWHPPWRILSEMPRERALAFLKVPGRCAIMPSRVENSPYAVLECIGRGIPFLASSVGGTPELIRSDWRKAVLFPNSPEDLCRAIKWILAEGAVIVPPEVLFEETRRQWLAWHSSLPKRRGMSASSG